MRILLSPAKKMVEDTDTLAARGLPRFLDRTEQLLAALRQMSYEQRKALWNCSDKLAQQNSERLEQMDLRRNLTPALLAYEGIAYQYMAPGVFTDRELAYVAEHLRILSGFYGILRPLDGVTPYRLEMGAKLAVAGARDLYEFWGGALARDVQSETGMVVNLASKEYSRAVEPYLSGQVRFLTCVFAVRKGGKLLEQGTACKMARGEMVRFLAERQVEDPAEIKTFDRLGYRFLPEESGPETLVFLKQ